MNKAWQKTIYVSKNLGKIQDEYGSYVESYATPVKYEVNVQPISGGIEAEVFGSKAMQIQKAVVPITMKDTFFENDLAYLDGATPTNEASNGYNANYRIVSVRIQNKIVAIYFEKRAGR